MAGAGVSTSQMQTCATRALCWDPGFPEDCSGLSCHLLRVRGSWRKMRMRNSGSQLTAKPAFQPLGSQPARGLQKAALLHHAP